MRGFVVAYQIDAAEVLEHVPVEELEILLQEPEIVLAARLLVLQSLAPHGPVSLLDQLVQGPRLRVLAQVVAHGEDQGQCRDYDDRENDRATDVLQEESACGKAHWVGVRRWQGAGAGVRADWGAPAALVVVAVGPLRKIRTL